MGACDSKDNCRRRNEEEAEVDYNQLKYTQATIKDRADSKLRVGKSHTLTEQNMKVSQNGR